MTTISPNAIKRAKAALEDAYGDPIIALLMVADYCETAYQLTSCGFIRDRQPEYRRQPRASVPPPEPVLTSGGQ